MIRLRVVGVFYDAEFSPTGILTIKDLLDVAVLKEQGSFSYVTSVKFKTVGGTPKAINSLFGFANRLRGDGIPESLGAKVRSAGYYKLFESTSVERDSVTVHAWQYYVIRGESVVSNYWNGAELNGEIKLPDVSPAVPRPFDGSAPGFTPFDTMELVDGDEVVWRNVSIVRNPQTEPVY